MNADNRSGKVNVLHLIASESVGGPEKQLLTHCRFYDKSRFALTIGTFKERQQASPLVEALRRSSIPYIEIEHRFLLDFSIISELRRQLVANRIDVLITHGYKSNIVGYYAHQRTPAVQAMYVRGWTAENWKVHIYNRLDLHYLKKAAVIVTVADNKRVELERMTIDTRRIRYIANAVEIPIEKGSRSLRGEFDINPDVFLMVAAGRLSPEKGHRQLILSLNKLSEHSQDFFCVIFGDGPLKDSLLKLVNDLNLNEKIAFMGYDPLWKDFLGEVDLLVNPSLSEVMPNVVMESMAGGCPVLATDVGGVSELIIDGETGFLAKAASPEEIHKGIIRFLERRDTADAVARRAFRHVQGNFSFVNQASKLNSLYKELACMY